METKSLDDLKPNKKNPRIISKEDFEALKNSIKKFGDLSGIIYNKASNQLAGGHQRVEAFKAIGGQKKVTITQRFDSPNKHGTIAVGYVTLDNEFYAYREVSWPLDSVDEDTGEEFSSIEVAANIAANRISGQFDQDMLAQINYELNKLENGEELLTLTGQTKDEINKLLDLVGADGDDKKEPGKSDAITFHFTPEQLEIVEEALNYILAKDDFSKSGNSDRRASAIYKICQDLLDQLHGAP